MAFSSLSYTADGVSVDYAVTFDYLDQSHIAVLVDKVRTTEVGSNYTFEWINSNTIRVRTVVDSLPVPAGLEVNVLRETPIDNPAVIFGGGASLSSENLNKNSQYLTFALQEATDANDAFTTLYLGSKSVAPTVDNAGGALRVGAIYFNTNDNTPYYWTGSVWNKGDIAGVAQSFANAAEASATAAAASESLAQSAKTAAETAQAGAVTAQTAAETAKTAAETAQVAAEAAETSATAEAVAAAASAAAALASQNAANASAIAAAASETAAATSETNAGASETAAAASAAAASASETAASASASAASASETAAGASATAAAASASAASASETAAAASESASASSASAAGTSETNAASSASAASSSASAASTSASNASTSASAAAASASAASTSETNAAASASAASTSETNAAASAADAAQSAANAASFDPSSYYTKTESDANYADASHGHAQSDITGLVSALAAKASLTGTETLTNKTLTTPTINNPLLGGVVRENIYSFGSVSGTRNITPVNGSIQTITLSGNVTFTQSLNDGETVSMLIDNGAANTVTWFSITWMTDDGNAPTLKTTGYTTVVLTKISGTVYGWRAGDGG